MSIDVNIPISRKGFLAAVGAAAVVVGTGAYCAAHQNPVKVVCPQSLSDVVRGHLSEFTDTQGIHHSVTYIFVADDDCTAEAVSSLCDTHHADAVIYKSCDPFDALDTSRVAAMPSEIVQTMKSFVCETPAMGGTDADIRMVPICLDLPVLVYGDEVQAVLNETSIDTLLNALNVVPVLRSSYPDGIIGVEASAQNSWGLATCLDYVVTAHMVVENSVGEPDDITADPRNVTNNSFYSLITQSLIASDSEYAQSSDSVLKGLQNSAYPMAIMRSSMYVAHAQDGNYQAISFSMPSTDVAPVMYASYGVCLSSEASSGSSSFVKELVGETFQQTLSKKVGGLPVRRDVEAPESIRALCSNFYGSGDSYQDGDEVAQAHSSWVASLDKSQQDQLMDQARVLAHQSVPDEFNSISSENGEA